jgi:hypothetical protein
MDEQKRLVYKLRVQKQAGISQLPVEISVKAPDGYIFFSSSDEWSHNQVEDLFTWRGSLNGSKDFQIIFAKSN